MRAAPRPLPSRHRERERLRGDHEWLAGAFESCSECLHGAQVGCGRVGEVGEVVYERQVNDAVRGDRTVPQAVKIIERAAVHIRAGRGE